MIIINKEKSEYNKIQLRNSELTKRNYRKSSIKPPGGGAYFKHIWGLGGGLIWEEALFNLPKTMVSVLHKELEYKVEKFN